MPWARFEPTLHSHDKIAELSDAAYRLWTCSISWSVAQLTDGEIPPLDRERHPLRRALGLAPARFNRLAAELAEKGFWEPNGSKVRIHDFLKYQQSKEEVERERELAKERQRKRRESALSHGVTESVTPDGVTTPERTSGRTSPQTPRRKRGEELPPAPQPPMYQGRCDQCGLLLPNHEAGCKEAS